MHTNKFKAMKKCQVNSKFTDEPHLQKAETPVYLSVIENQSNFNTRNHKKKIHYLTCNYERNKWNRLLFIFHIGFHC